MRKSLLVLSLTAALAACIAVVAASATTKHVASGGLGPITNPPPALTTPPATKPKFITIRVWSGAYQQAFAKSAGAAFTKATGVKIHWDTTDEFVSYQKIDQEIRAGKRPDADASMQAQQRAYLDAVRGLTLPISGKVAPNALKANFLVAAPQGTPAGAKTWAYMNPYTVTIGFVVRKDKIDPSEVQKWSDLANSKFAHSIVFDQIYSTTAFALARSMGVNPAKNPPSSLDPVWARIKSLRPNLASLGSGADVTTALTNGTATIGITCTCNTKAAIASGTPLEMVAPRDGGYEVADSYYIHKNIPAANYYYAELFANYLYANATQSYLANDQALVPTVPSAAIPAYMKAQPRLFPRTAAQVKAANMVIAPIPLMARYDAQWQTSFEAAIK